SLPAAALPYFRTSAVSAFDSMFKEMNISAGKERGLPSDVFISARLRGQSAQALRRATEWTQPADQVCLLGPLGELHIQAPCQGRRLMTVLLVPLVQLHIWLSGG
ncbi:hypothetical protein KUCAC02_003538, partial [Chaenocephalus aceratus]